MKYEHAVSIMPPNTLKQKAGSGGIDPEKLVKAQTALDNNPADFTPLAQKWLAQLDETLQSLKQDGAATGTVAINALLYPLIKLNEQGSLFGFPLITEISEIIIGLLETRPVADKNLLAVVAGHRLAISNVLSLGMKGDGGQPGALLKSSLRDAVSRYIGVNK
jgi:hypothetical protein